MGAANANSNSNSNSNSLDKEQLYSSIESIMYSGLCDVSMHEVGHTLGLRHNFVASSSPDHSWQQLGNRTNVLLHGVATSVMDYNSINIRSVKQQKEDIAAGRSTGNATENQDLYFMKKVGSYDISAIKYGYSNPKPDKPTNVGVGNNDVTDYETEGLMSTISGDSAPIIAAAATTTTSANAALLYTANGQVAPVFASAFDKSGTGNLSYTVQWNRALSHIAATAPAFETDEDVSEGNPYAQRHDLAQEPMDYHMDRLQLVREIREMMTNHADVKVEVRSGRAATQELVKDGDSWERWWKLERVLLGTVANSGKKIAQYIGGSSMNKAHRGDGDAADSAAPVTPVTWQKQRDAVQVLVDIYNNSNSNGNSSLYPPASQYRYMVQRAKPTWCRGSGSLFDYCYGQKPVDVAAKLNSMKLSILAEFFSPDRLGRLDSQAISADMGAEESAMAVMELLDTATRSVWGNGNEDEGGNITFAAGAAATWPMQRAWLNLVAGLAQAEHAGVSAAAYGELLVLQDRASSTLKTLMAMPKPMSTKAALEARNFRGHLKSQLVAMKRTFEGNEDEKTRKQMTNDHSMINSAIHTSALGMRK